MRRHWTKGYSNVIGATLLALAFTSGNASANPEIYQRALRSSVFVLSLREEGVSVGSGVLVDKGKRLVVTNQHVVGEQGAVRVCFPLFRDGQVVSDPDEYIEARRETMIEALVVAKDRTRDLALLQLTRLPNQVESLALAATSASPGQTVHAIGNSGIEGTGAKLGGALWRYSKGEVRQIYCKPIAGSLFRAWVVETQVPSNPGDSGGPVVNDQGELVAVTVFGSTSSSLVTYGVDVREVKHLLKELATNEGQVDIRLRKAVEMAELKFHVGNKGTLELPYGMEDDSTQVVYLASQTQRLIGLETREIWSVAAASKEPPSPAAAQKLLEANADLRLGAWQVIKTEQGYIIAFCVQVPAELDPASLKRAAAHVTNTTYEMKKLLALGELSRLVGTWKAKQADGDEKKAEVVLTLHANGTFTFQMNFDGDEKEFTGKYTYKALLLSLHTKEEGKLEGRISWQSERRFTLDLGEGKELHFQRQE